MTDDYLTRPVTLEPFDYPPPPYSMQTFAPADASGALDLGPGFLDSETVQALHDAVLAGTFTLDPAWSEVLAAVTNNQLEDVFADRLRRSPLSASSPTLHHRRLALYEAMRQIGANGTIPGFGFGVHNVSRAIGDVETWMEGRRQHLASLGVAEDQVTRMLAMLSPAQLSALLQTSEANLANWRDTGRGPAYAKLSQRTVRYPVAAVLDWLQGVISR